MPPQKRFRMRGSIVAVLEPNHLRRRTSGRHQIKKIGIRCYDDESVISGILPNHLVRGESSQARMENVGRIRKELCETANELWREIRVK